MTNSTPAPRVCDASVEIASSLQRGQCQFVDLVDAQISRELATHDCKTTGGNGGFPFLPGALNTCCSRPPEYI